MIPELVNRWERLDIKTDRTAHETGEYIALLLAMGEDWADLPPEVQRTRIKWNTAIATNIIQHGDPYYKPTPTRQEQEY